MTDPLTPESGANPHAAQVRIAALKATSVGGQRAHDLRIGPQPAYVAEERSHLNRVLVKPETGTRLRRICEDRRALRDTTRAMKSNASVGVAGIITFGIEAQKLFQRLTPDQQDAAYRETAEAVASRLNTTLTGLVVHHDETAPHAHFQLPAYDMTGQPISMTAKRDAMRDLQTITAQVMGRHAPGIERGRSISQRLAAGADYPDTMHRSVKELHRDLPAEIEAKRQVVADLSAAEDAARERVDEMQRRVDDLHARADLSEKEIKRLAVYGKRLSDRLDELRKAEAASEGAKAAADRLAEVARQEAHDVRAQTGRVVDKAMAMVNASVALAGEIGAGTVRMNASGKIDAADPDAIRPGLPQLRPALQAGAQAVASFEAQKVELARERHEVDQERQRLAGLGLIIEQAQKALRLVLELAPRVRSRIRDRSALPSERREAAAMRRDIVAAVPPLRQASLTSTASIMQMLREKPKPSPAPEKTVEEPDTDDGPSGP